MTSFLLATPRRVQAGSSRLRSRVRVARRTAMYSSMSSAKGTLGERAVADVVVLLEAFDGRPVAAGDAQGAVGKDALGVADVAEHLFRAPFAGSVAEIAVGLVAAAEQDHRVAPLGVEGRQNVGCRRPARCSGHSRARTRRVRGGQWSRLRG